MITVKVKSTLRDVSQDSYLLGFTDSAVTVKEIIESAVRIEVSTNARDRKALNTQQARLPDLEKETYLALTAFQNHEYFVIVDHHHATALDEIVGLRDNSEIKFLRVTPLVGG